MPVISFMKMHSFSDNTFFSLKSCTLVSSGTKETFPDLNSLFIIFLYNAIIKFDHSGSDSFGDLVSKYVIPSAKWNISNAMLKVHTGLFMFLNLLVKQWMY